MGQTYILIKRAGGYKSMAHKLQFHRKQFLRRFLFVGGVKEKFVKYLKQHEVDNLLNINFYLIVRRDASQ